MSFYHQPLIKTVMEHAVNRRELLLESAAALTFGSAFVAGCGGKGGSAQAPSAQPATLATPEQAGQQLVTQSATWKRLPVGAGGYVTGIDISNDGSTKVIRTDTINGYVWDDGLNQWRPLFTVASLGRQEHIDSLETEGLSEGPGVYEARVAPNDPNRIYATFRARVYRSDDKGRTFKRTSLEPKQMRSNHGEQRLWGPKMAVDPVNPDVVYLGTEKDGLWRTLDGGASWSLVADVPKSTTENLPLMLAFDPSSGTISGRTKTLYVASDGHGVYRTTDAGTSFAMTPGGPTKNKRMICGGDGTLWFLENGRANNLMKFAGGRWSAVPSHDHNWRVIAVNPANPHHLFMVTDSGAPTQSFDGGASWMGVWHDNYPDGEGIRVIANDIPWLATQKDKSAGDLRFDPSQANKLYFAMGVGVMWCVPPKTYTRMDWYTQSLGIEQMGGWWITVPPGGDPLVLCWDRPVFKITDETKYPKSYGPDIPLHHGWHAEYATTNPSFVAGVFNYNGINRDGWSADGGATWTRFATQPSDALGGCLAVSAPDNIVLVPSSNGRAVYTRDRGRTWTPVNIPGLPTTGQTGWGWAHYFDRKIVAADRVKSGVFYLYNYGPETAKHLAGVYRSTDEGVSWAKVFSGQVAEWSYYHAHMRSVPGQMGHLFFTSGGQSGAVHPAPIEMMRSKDGGSTWTPLSKVQEVLAVGFGKAAPNASYPAVYIAGWVKSEYGIWASFDDCRTWVKLADYPLDNIDAISSIEGDMDKFGRVYVGFNGSGVAYGDVSAWTAAA